MRDITDVIRSLASSHHGVVTREELLAAGVGPAAVGRAVRSGRLEPRHPGVYVVAGAPHLWRARVLADVRYVHRQARRLDPDTRAVVAATGSTAAFLHRLPHIRRPQTVVLVTNPLSRSRAVVTLPRPTLSPSDVVDVEHVPCTTVTWTMVETAAVLPRAVQENMVAEAIRSGRTSVQELLTTASRMADSPGRDELVDVLDSLSGDDLRARSGTERRLRRGMADRGYPAAEVNARVRLLADGRVLLAPELDLWLAELGLDVEIDGIHHELPEQRRRDRERDALLARADVWVERIPVSEIDHDLEGVLDRVGEVIAMRQRHVTGDHGACPPGCQPHGRATELALDDEA